MAADSPEIRKSSKNKIHPLVIKKTTRVSVPHRGGTWKIAYADFVTAMMAFFLLMWLTANSTQAQLRGVSEYFQTPLVAFAGGKDMSDRNSILHDGSNSLAEGNAQLKKGDIPQARHIESAEVQREARRKEMAYLQMLKRSVEQEIDAHLELREFKDQLLIDITTQGLRIQIIDKQNRPTFALGSANLQPYATDILHRIGGALNGVPNKIGITGHTDAAPYQGGERNYSNWELSMDRANAARRALAGGGMEEQKIIRVVGLSSSALFDQTDPLSPRNRRISIIVMNTMAEREASPGGAALEGE